MKVSEFIQKLQEMDQDLEVVVIGGDGDYSSNVGLDQVVLFKADPTEDILFNTYEEDDTRVNCCAVAFKR